MCTILWIQYYSNLYIKTQYHTIDEYLRKTNKWCLCVVFVVSHQVVRLMSPSVGASSLAIIGPVHVDGMLTLGLDLVVPLSTETNITWHLNLWAYCLRTHPLKWYGFWSWFCKWFKIYFSSDMAVHQLSTHFCHQMLVQTGFLGVPNCLKNDCK